LPVILGLSQDPKYDRAFGFWDYAQNDKHCKKTGSRGHSPQGCVPSIIKTASLRKIAVVKIATITQGCVPGLIKTASLQEIAVVKIATITQGCVTGLIKAASLRA
jgi:hypothetical protein